MPLTPIAEQPMLLRDSDAFLLCTDGLWEYVSEARMLQELGATVDAAGLVASPRGRGAVPRAGRT
jgi:serine/threonine protein phosphatase PrpC